MAGEMHSGERIESLVGKFQTRGRGIGPPFPSNPVPYPSASNPISRPEHDLRVS
jgi:hypothetical protein